MEQKDYLMETYMSVDEFLEKYYTALNRGDWGSRFFWYETTEETPQKFFEWYNEQNGGLKTSEVQELYAEIAKAMQSGTPDARNFLYTVQVLTAFDNAHTGKNVPSGKLREYANVILYAIQNGTIKKLENSYQVLEHIVWAIGKDDPVLLRQVALHPLATPDDVKSWLSYYLNGPYAQYDGSVVYEYKKSGLKNPEFIGSINDAKKKLNDLVAIIKDNVAKELSKPIPNSDTIKSFGISDIPRIAKQIVAIVEYLAGRIRPELKDGQTKEDVANAKAVADELAREFDINKILDVSNGNYVQQYADQAEIKLAEMRPQYGEMQTELGSLRKSYSDVNRQLHEVHTKINQLEDDKAKLLRENSNLMSTIDFLKGKIKLFLAAFKKRAEERELPIKKAKGLQEVVANDLEGAINIEQIERDLSTARQRQTEIMRNSPVRI